MPRAPMPVTLAFAATMFASSFLLFMIEPMQGKLLLPLLGGTPAVWNTCMVFFQGALLLGYLYAHLLVTYVPLRWQAWIHALVVLAPILLLPPALPLFAQAGVAPNASPILFVLTTLALSSGPAFFALATTSPLLQAWFHRVGGARANPYALYAAGNVGSLLALAAYPLVCEPFLRLREQAWTWAAGYGVYLALLVLIGVAMRRRLDSAAAVAAPPADAPANATVRPPAPELGVLTPLYWVLLAFVPSSLMLGVTAFMTADVAAIPMLWLLPLMLYVLSFILVFSRWGERADRRLAALAPWLVATVLFLVFSDFRRNMWLIITLHLTGFFLVSLACHGRLALRRPDPRRLTAFYFCMSLGGVLGGLFNTLVAPLVFPRVAEYPLVLAVAVLAMATRERRALAWVAAAAATAAFGALLYGMHAAANKDLLAPVVTVLKHWIPGEHVVTTTLTYGVPLLLAVAFFLRPLYMGSALLGVVLVALFYDADHNVLFRSRSFFGVLTVKEYAGGIHSLVNGGILHGEQKMDSPADRATPRTYYHREGPLGQLMELVQARFEHPSIAAVGLGSGTVAAYGTKDNSITFYELDPHVEALARDTRYFTYVDDCEKRGCNLKVVLGDARLQLARAAERYDLIILDAFSSDAIPVHLLTLEALDVYRAHLNPGGIIAYHISNRYLNLEPVLYNIGKERRMIYAVDKDDGDDEVGKSGSTWVAMSPSDDLMGYLVVDARWEGLTPKRGIGIWADDYANVAKAFTWY